MVVDGKHLNFFFKWSPLFIIFFPNERKPKKYKKSLIRYDSHRIKNDLKYIHMNKSSKKKIYLYLITSP